MIFTHTVNALTVQAYYDDRQVEDVFLPLLRRLTAMQQEKGIRLLVLMAAPPGAGKTTLSLFLQHLSETVPGLTPLDAIGIDGFHRYRDDLNSHTTLWNGQEIPMIRVKGAPQTFDIMKMCGRVRTILQGGACKWPEYSRQLHDPVEDTITVSRDIVLLEGNYVLLDLPGWRDIRSMADYTIFIRADANDVRERLIARKIAGGSSPEDAEAYVSFTDMPNLKQILETSVPANMTL